ncbi:unnamed protein product [Microthlaspi erraticum]|uniref:FKB95-like N-terminal Kelch domain-containing protein n=1 Tax=Microthlaspi erraticum TaxID=1685480 RepID=A0A6D2KHR3_9BRAS|nr:unnamed protein product [Microthlaspi erraticum]
MKGRKASAIRGCSQLKLKTKKKKEKETEVCGLGLLPDDVFVDCLTRVSRLDLVALGMVSRRHRYGAESEELTDMRHRRGSVDPYLYVFLHMHPDPSPRWFVLHPVQRQLKPIYPGLYPAPVEGSCFVKTKRGIYTMGGLMNGEPTSEVTFLDCIEHIVYQLAPMKMARSGASAVLIDERIYVFGGCWDQDVADSSNWVEVHDIGTPTWELLPVSTPPKTPLKIKQSVVMMDKNLVYAVDEQGQVFVFSARECMFEAEGRTESKPETKNDWLLANYTFLCRGIGGKVLWRAPGDLEWEEVQGLEELQQQHPGFEIIKLCVYSAETLVIFWEARPQGVLELWYAEFSLSSRMEGEVWVVRGSIRASGSVLSDSDSSYTGLNLLCAASLHL